MDHPALAVRDQERARRFYERYAGFGAAPPYRASDGTLIIFDARGFSLALGATDEPIALPAFLHFGRNLATPEEVRALRERFVADGVAIADWHDDPDDVSVKCRDPDGYVVEFAWEPD